MLRARVLQAWTNLQTKLLTAQQKEQEMWQVIREVALEYKVNFNSFSIALEKYEDDVKTLSVGLGNETPLIQQSRLKRK